MNLSSLLYFFIWFISPWDPDRLTPDPTVLLCNTRELFMDYYVIVPTPFSDETIKTKHK